MKIIYQELDYNNTDDINAAARIHEEAPLEWDESWLVTSEGIAEWVTRINNLKNINPMFLLFAKLSNGEIVGFHWLRLYEKNGSKHAHIDSLWVSKDYRRMGIATELKNRGENWAKSVGAEKLTTNVFLENKKMFELNSKLGFKSEAVKMSKSLI